MTAQQSSDQRPRLHLFGTPILKDAQNKILSVRGRKSMALLAYLAVTHPQVHSRERLADLFWPDSTDKDARNSLRVSVSRISHVLGSSAPPLLTTTRLTVALNAESLLLCDVVEFRNLLKLAATHDHSDGLHCIACIRQMTEASNLYTADFMEAFHVADCEDYEEWQFGTREQFRAAAMDTIATLIRQAVTTGDMSAAEHNSRQLLVLDPFRESAHRILMRAMAHSGNKTGALAHFSLMKSALRKELGASPENETLALVSSIESGEFPATADKEAPDISTAGALIAPHNLPFEKMPYIGNSLAQAKLIRQLGEHRLVTLTGIGGVGKSRLAVQVSHTLLSSFPGGIWLVKLASVSSHSELLAKLASVLGVQLLPGDEAIISICNQITHQKLLLILDNFEHLISECDFVETLLEQTENLTILVTSRQRLQFSGESVFPVPGLSYSRTQTADRSDTAQGGDAFRLFVDVASRAGVDFEANSSNRQQIQQIVELVEGHPLAIVIAASWVDGLSCRQILQELVTGLEILQTDSSAIPKRQRSIRAAFNYSWNLLKTQEQTLFASLSVFRGGFDKQAAENITGATYQSITRLLRKSLLQHLPGLERYEMHELMRQYAEEKLCASNAELTIREAHSHHYLNVLNDYTATHLDLNASLEQHSFHTEFNNISKAWHFALEQGHEDTLVKATNNLRIMCSLTTHSHALLELLEPVLHMIEHPEKDDTHPELALNLLLAIGFAYRYTSGYFARELGDIFARAYALADSLKTSPELFIVLYGKWSFNFTSGSLSDNAPLLTQWRERLAMMDQDERIQPYAHDARFVIHMLEGPQLQCTGEFTKAREVILAGLELEDGSRYSAMIGHYGLNFAVSGRHWLAINQCIAGFMDQCSQTITEAHHIALCGNNPYMRMFVAFGQLVIATLCADVTRIRAHANAVNTLVTEHRIFGAFQHHADIYSAYAKSIDDTTSDLAHLQSLIDSGNGIPIFRLFDVQLLADALVRAGRAKEALQYLKIYTEPAERRMIRFSLSESARIEGDAFQASGDIAQAQHSYDKSMSIASRQQAGLYTLRTGSAMASFLAQQNKPSEARALLTPIINALPECRSIIDYKKANEVLRSIPESQQHK
ncbi:MAG: BTAD domain-containing putative transcriptional regulator [Granulosicoccus sp.]